MVEDRRYYETVGLGSGRWVVELVVVGVGVEGGVVGSNVLVYR